VNSAVAWTSDKVNIITEAPTVEETNKAMLDNDMLNKQWVEDNEKKYVCYDCWERKTPVNTLNNISHSRFPIDWSILIVQIVNGKAIVID